MICATESAGSTRSGYGIEWLPQVWTKTYVPSSSSSTGDAHGADAAESMCPSAVVSFEVEAKTEVNGAFMFAVFQGVCVRYEGIASFSSLADSRSATNWLSMDVAAGSEFGARLGERVRTDPSLIAWDPGKSTLSSPRTTPPNARVC